MLVTNGGKHAVFNAFAALLDPGDEVLLPGAVLDHLPRGRSRSPAASPVVIDDRRDDRLPGHRRPARGGPHRAHQGAAVRVALDNPTGAVYPPDEVEAIGRWAVEHGIWVVTDEIYEHLTYGDHRVHARCRRWCPSCADQCVVVNGVAKTYAMTGWRVGWMIGPPDVIKAATNLQSHATSNVANVAQRAALAAVSRRPRRRGR